jgi:ubiquinone biosynthesis monooxygenase Coq7
MWTSETPEFTNIRRTGWLDRLLAEVDHALRTALATPEPGTPSPGNPITDAPLSGMERKQVESLMRINHTGEIAAQALYRGQALVANTATQRDALLQAADEEQDHLAWCAQRINELDGHISYLAPAWYAGSFLIGLSAGLAGDRWSLGFIEETEMQVSAHLDDHLERLPESDQRSRAILARMRTDEARHADAARAAGAEPLPPPVKKLMTGIADLMRLVSARL